MEDSLKCQINPLVKYCQNEMLVLTIYKVPAVFSKILTVVLSLLDCRSLIK